MELLELKFQFFSQSDVITADRFPYKAADHVLTTRRVFPYHLKNPCSDVLMRPSEPTQSGASLSDWGSSSDSAACGMEPNWPQLMPESTYPTQEVGFPHDGALLPPAGPGREHTGAPVAPGNVRKGHHMLSAPRTDLLRLPSENLQDHLLCSKTTRRR